MDFEEARPFMEKNHRGVMRDVYRACGDNDHPDWEEYDQSMVSQDASVVLVKPERVYGTIRWIAPNK